MNDQSDLKGVFTPTMVPLDPNGDICEAELRKYIDWLIDHGVHGLYPNGSTGEFTRFTPEERRRIIQIHCDQVGGRVPILAGAAEANVRETLGTCEFYLQCGARAVAIVSPFYYRLSAEAVYAYFREIAINSPIDVTVYNIPMLANPIDVATVRRLAELPRVIGIKDSSGDISHMMRMIAAIEPVRPGFSFLTGWEPALTPMLAIGCHGATLAMSGVVPELTRQMYEVVEAGDLASGRRLQTSLTTLFDAVVDGADFPEGVRSAIEVRGFTFGPSRQPRGSANQMDLENIRQLIGMVLSSQGDYSDS
jgi:dihydrodipicolinate synthase/N-acetylneuraminate lyase